MNQIQKISRILLVFIYSLLVLLPLRLLISVSLSWKTAPFFSTEVLSTKGRINLAHIVWTPLSRSICIAAELADLIAVFISLWILKALFQNYKKGEIFTLKNASYYSYLSFTFFINALIIKPLSEMLFLLGATISNQTGERLISISISSLNIEQLFYGAIALAVSWIMVLAAKMQIEQESTI